MSIKRRGAGGTRQRPGPTRTTRNKAAMAVNAHFWAGREGNGKVICGESRQGQQGAEAQGKDISILSTIGSITLMQTNRLKAKNTAISQPISARGGGRR